MGGKKWDVVWCYVLAIGSRVVQKSSFWAALSQFLFLSPGYLTIYLNMGEIGGKDASLEFLEERQDTARCIGKYQWNLLLCELYTCWAYNSNFELHSIGFMVDDSIFVQGTLLFI